MSNVSFFVSNYVGRSCTMRRIANRGRHSVPAGILRGVLTLLLMFPLLTCTVPVACVQRNDWVKVSSVHVTYTRFGNVRLD